MKKLKTQNCERLEQEAVSWHVRLTSGDVKASDKAQFEEWCTRSPAHGQAYHKIVMLWDQLDIPLLAHRKLHGEIAEDNSAAGRLSETPESSFSQREKVGMRGLKSNFKTPHPSPLGNRSRRCPTSCIHAVVPVGEGMFRSTQQLNNWGKGLAIAASIAIVVAFGLYPDYLRNPWADYRTHIGEHTTINLADGSVVHLNTNSAINTTLTDHERHVVLLRGEAEFEIAHDTQRPFTVSSGQITTLAVGTKFLVRYDGSQGLVTLLEGKVRTSGIPIDSQTKNEIMLKPGQQVAFQDNLINPITHPDMANADAWKKGRLLMNFVTLEQALTEINRYRRGTVKLLDDKLAKQEINAAIDIGNIDAWLDALQDTLPLHVHRVGPLALITAK
jgi:transmembrane sensor